MSTTFDPFWDLSLPIPSGRNVELKDCLSAFTSDETLGGEEMPVGLMKNYAIDEVHFEDLRQMPHQTQKHQATVDSSLPEGPRTS